MSKWIARFCTGIGAFKIYIVIQMLVQMILAPLVPWLGKAGNICIVLWAFAILVYDFFHSRDLLHRGVHIWELIFLAAVAVSILVNFRTNLLDNVETYLILLIEFLVLIPAYRQDRETLKRDILWFVNILAAAMFLCSLVGFVLYAADYALYSYEYRFCGVFSNPNLSSVMSFWGVTASAAALTFKPKRYIALYRTGHIVNLLLTFVMFTIANSNTGKVMFAAACAAVCFLLPFTLELKAKTVWRILSGILAAAAGIVLSFTLYSGVQETASYLPGTIRYIENASTSDQPSTPPVDKPSIDKTDFDRENSGVQIDNNRFEIWREGLETFTHRPLFGCGPRNLWSAVNTCVEEPRSEIEAGGLHNMYIELLVVCGIAGFVTFVLFVLRRGIPVLVFVFRNDIPQQRKRVRMVILFAGLLAFLAMNMTEGTMLFSTTPYAVCFWVILGFMFNYIALYGHKNPENTTRGDRTC